MVTEFEKRRLIKAIDDGRVGNAIAIAFSFGGDYQRIAFLYKDAAGEYGVFSGGPLLDGTAAPEGGPYNTAIHLQSLRRLATS